VNSRSTLLVVKLCSILSKWIPSKIVYCSNQALNVHETFGYMSEKSLCIHNGYDTNLLVEDRELRDSFRAAYLGAHDEICFGMVARWDSQKDHVNLLKALSLLKSRGLKGWKCLLIGDGMSESNEELVPLIDKYGLTHDLILLGRQDDIKYMMNGMEFTVLSSVGESFPNVLAESMLCATPCVSTNVGEAMGIVGDVGQIVPAQRSDLLSEAIEDMILLIRSDADSFEDLGKRSRERICAKFSLESMIGQYHNVWK
jgi:glycosyltransferase involved in cell wall biosynthesis